MSEEQIIPAGHGLAVTLRAGDTLTIVNASGTQVVDTWAYAAADPSEVLSMEHSRVDNGRLCAKEGGVYVTDRRDSLLRVVRDASPGIHDTIMAACDARRYVNLGCRTPHRNCADNLREAMAAIGRRVDRIPQPLNLFMNIPVCEDMTLVQGEPQGRPGDFITLEALRDCIVAMSACPQDITPINGGKPTDVPIRIERATPAA